MSVYATPEENAANPPDTWTVVKGYGGWHLTDQHGTVLDRFRTKREAEQARTDGQVARLWDQERRWYAGETIPGWKPYAELRGN